MNEAASQWTTAQDRGSQSGRGASQSQMEGIQKEEKNIRNTLKQV